MDIRLPDSVNRQSIVQVICFSPTSNLVVVNVMIFDILRVENNSTDLCGYTSVV